MAMNIATTALEYGAVNIASALFIPALIAAAALAAGAVHRFNVRRARRAAILHIQRVAWEARYWAGTSRERAGDAECIAAVAAGPQSQEFRSLVTETMAIW